jgi:hypothetical protein
MKTATVNNQMLQRLNILTERIRTNTASVPEYNEYEQILITSGAFDHTEIFQYLKNANLNSYESLIDARNRAITIADKKAVEGVVIVGLVALGLALIFGAGRK